MRDGGGPVTVAVTPLPGTGIWLVRSPGASRQPLNGIGLLSHKNDSTAAAEPCAAFSLAAGRVSDKHQSARASRCGGLLSASPTCISAFGAAASVGARLNYPRRPPCRREPCFPQRWSPAGCASPPVNLDQASLFKLTQRPTLCVGLDAPVLQHEVGNVKGVSLS